MTPITPTEAQQTLDSVVGFVANLKAEMTVRDAWVLQNHFQKLAEFIASKVEPNDSQTQ